MNNKLIKLAGFLFILSSIIVGWYDYEALEIPLLFIGAILLYVAAPKEDKTVYQVLMILVGILGVVYYLFR